MFELTCFGSSHEKLIHEMLFDIETDVLQNSVKEFSLRKVAVRIQLY